MFPGCPASRAPRGSTLALLSCQGSAGSVGDSGPGFRRLWGFGWVSCGLGFLGSSSFSQGGRARPPRVMKATLSGLAQTGEGAHRSTGGPQITAHGLTLPVAHLALVPCPSTFLAPPLPSGLRMGAAQGEDLGKRQWRREQRKQISRERKQGSGRIREK